MSTPIPAGEFFSLPSVGFANEPVGSALCATCAHQGISKAFCQECGGRLYMDDQKRKGG